METGSKVNMKDFLDMVRRLCLRCGKMWLTFPICLEAESFISVIIWGYDSQLNGRNITSDNIEPVLSKELQTIFDEYRSTEMSVSLTIHHVRQFHFGFGVDEGWTYILGNVIINRGYLRFISRGRQTLMLLFLLAITFNELQQPF